MKKYFLIFLTILLAGLTAFSQEDDDQELFFGSLRGIPFDSYDFGKITDQKAVATFTYVNTSRNKQTFVSINPPEGIAVVIEKKTLQPREKTHIYVIIDKEYYKTKGNFDFKIPVSVKEEVSGMELTKSFFYQITGEL